MYQHLRLIKMLTVMSMTSEFKRWIYCRDASTDGRYIRSNAQGSANKIFIAVLFHLINLYIDHI